MRRIQSKLEFIKYFQTTTTTTTTNIITLKYRGISSKNTDFSQISANITETQDTLIYSDTERLKNYNILKEEKLSSDICYSDNKFWWSVEYYNTDKK